MKKVKIASIQMKVSEDKEANLRHLEELMKSREVKEADLAVVPEMFNCPYVTAGFPVYAEKEGGMSWERCAALAAGHRIYLSAGSMPEVDEEGHVYNTAYVFDRNGQQIAKHRKVHLFDIDVEGQYFKESDTLSSGDQVTVFETEFCKMGICICYDFRFPELSRLMAEQGAKIILVPGAFNMTTGPAHWELLFRQRAVDNQVYAVGTAPARDERASYHSWGHSIVTDPWGNVVMEMDEKEHVVLTEIDLDKVEKIREQLPLLKQLRRDVYEWKTL
ncbi:carbon-nitrogen hydrolase family protein [Faecalicatena contorta]|uniref:carbon-nitrogen hydrolase family protein n=1 Tax=Faecalicatena contorta TaxID=39482 RepID=UPI001F300C18|nr:carbon-nitrogen hydrolase family protein [Faecalicatena contorta]MCF2683284.1 carbon-nitrogen hydrolase family protein [Faecalicatena contorta]